jgi:hypothetical protein
MQKQNITNCYLCIFQKRSILDRDAYGFPQACFVNPEFRPFQLLSAAKRHHPDFLTTAWQPIKTKWTTSVDKDGIS